MQRESSVFAGLGFCVGAVVGQFLPDETFWLPIAATLGTSIALVCAQRVRHQYLAHLRARNSARLETMKEYVTVAEARRIMDEIEQSADGHRSSDRIRMPAFERS